MKASAINDQSNLRLVHGEITKIRKELRMRTVIRIKDVKMWLFEALPAEAPAKVVARLVLGVVMLAATALAFGTLDTDGPNRALVSQQKVMDPEGNTSGTTSGYTDEYEDELVDPNWTPKASFVDEYELIDLDLSPKQIPTPEDFADEYEDELIDLDWRPTANPFTYFDEILDAIDK